MELTEINMFSILLSYSKEGQDTSEMHYGFVTEKKKCV